jgi:TRAP-type C4-dicarboxylate transport system permease small subunit
MDARERGDRPTDKPLILILVKRTAIFLLIICAVSLFYWIVGSESSFLDETQSMLLGIMSISSLGIVVASGIGVLLSLALAIARRFRLKAMGIAGYALAAAFGAAALVLARTISILSHGLH